MLTQAGYRAVSCRDGAEAIEYYRGHHADVDLVVLDMVMPNVGGYECLLALKEINPRVRAVISSGYAINDEVQRAMDAGARAFVQKPFEVEALTRAVTGALRP
jgi:CheY-like chemotaxis protein